jgi:hypothetical protein
MARLPVTNRMIMLSFCYLDIISAGASAVSSSYGSAASVRLRAGETLAAE